MSHVAVSPRRTRLPFFYGWVLVGVAFVTMAVGVNARTAFSLLFPPILGEFGWDRGVTAGAFSFGFLVSAVITRALAGSWTAAVRSSSSRRAVRRRGQLPRLYRPVALSAALVRAPSRAGP